MEAFLLEHKECQNKVQEAKPAEWEPSRYQAYDYLGRLARCGRADGPPASTSQMGTEHETSLKPPKPRERLHAAPTKYTLSQPGAQGLTNEKWPFSIIANLQTTNRLQGA